ncbi:uncharacterized protein BDR25DRAFT_310847 [Lindgomyces ingoldianus]|uniref:Uncharacterized protein n=1 Tax=Lindgomyces ingoldianus TaxID=673940 RepID=A0ACB6R8S0_9PLEO|nr:uncharacterized protein BDR25DRAFT_310847 [Lindgomyces ingoldianus]KAF2475487.1 hypothetical protein BDR25DRAFT_310847 [Lindgomyces ingoldianus]
MDQERDPFHPETCWSPRDSYPWHPPLVEFSLTSSANSWSLDLSTENCPVAHSSFFSDVEEGPFYIQPVRFLPMLDEPSKLEMQRAGINPQGENEAAIPESSARGQQPNEGSQGPKASSKREFSCPVFKADTVLGRKHSCRGARAEHMSYIRRHLTSGRAPHVAFLKLCGTCNEDFTDQKEFETNHGYDGEFCNNPQKQRRGESAEEQWYTLYTKLSPGAPRVSSPYIEGERSSRNTPDPRIPQMSDANSERVANPPSPGVGYHDYHPNWDSYNENFQPSQPSPKSISTPFELTMFSEDDEFLQGDQTSTSQRRIESDASDASELRVVTSIKSVSSMFGLAGGIEPESSRFVGAEGTLRAHSRYGMARNATGDSADGIRGRFHTTVHIRPYASIVAKYYMGLMQMVISNAIKSHLDAPHLKDVKNGPAINVRKCTKDPMAFLFINGKGTVILLLSRK